MEATNTWARRRARVALIAIVTSLLTAVASPPSAWAHGAEGVVDQQIDGAPTCDETQFPSTTVLDVLSSQRQTFTPAIGSLASVDLCLTVNVGEVLPGLPAFTMNVVEYGEDGEQTIASEDFSFSDLPLLGSDTRYWHVDLDEVVPVAPGGTYAIELTAPRLVFKWRATCGSDLQACPTGSPDRYPGGAASVGGATNDFGFRTWAPAAANIDVSVAAPPLVCPDAATLTDAAVTVRNSGTVDVGAFDVALAMGADGTEQPLGGTTVAGLPAGESVTLSGADFAPVAPPAGPSGTVELVATADTGGVIVESSETDNRAAATTTRVPCDEGVLDNLRLVAGDGSPLPDAFAGIVDLPMTGLSPQDVAAGAAGFAATTSRPEDGAPTQTDPTDSDTLQSSPIRLSPIRLSPIRLSPIRLSPIHLSPIRLSPIRLSPIHLSPIRLSTFFGTVDPGVLDQVFLVGIPVDGTWEELIAAYPDQPDVTNRAAAEAAAEELLAKAAQDRTLGDVLLRLDPPLDLRIDQVDLDAVMDLSMLGTTLSTQRLGTVPAPGGGSWCDFIAARSHLDCVTHGIDPTTESFVSLDLRGFPMDQIDLSGVSIAAIGLRTDTVLAGMPLADSLARPGDLPASTARIFRLAYTALGAMPAADVLTNPAALLVCDGSITQNPCEATIAEAEAAFAFRDNATVADLVAELTPAAAAAFDVPNALLGVTSLLDLPWARFDTDPLDLDELSQGACPGIPYRVSADVVSDAPVANPTLTIVLPRGFDPKAGTAMATVDGGTTFAIPDGEESVEDGRTTVDLKIPGVASSSVTATIQACASTTLGVFTADSDASWTTFDVSGPVPVLADRTVAPESESSTRPERHADVRVLEREEPDGADTTRVAAPETLILRHVPTGTDEDVFRIPLGQELPNGLTLQAGDRLRVWLAPPAGPATNGSVTDLDLTVYGPEQSPVSHALLESTPIRDADTPILATDDNGAEVDGATGSAPAQSVQDSPIHLSPIRLSPIHLSPIRLSAPRAVSSQRGDRGEYAEVDIRRGDSGAVTIRVSSYLGDADDRHYTLFYEVARPQLADVLATCPSPGDFSAATVTGAMPNVPAGTRTLILVNETLAANRHGASGTAMMSALQNLAAHDRVDGVVLPVERDADVAARFETWRGGGWCDVLAANRVVAEIRRLVVETVAAVPTVENIVLVGGDDLMPMARVSDRAALGNETQYLGDVLAATQQNNPLVAAYAAGTTMTDDPFGTLRPIPWQDEALFVPELAVGRLVESPADVVLAAEQFVASDGLLDPATALAAGYDFNADGAAAAADGLAELGAIVDDEFVDGGWSRNAITGRLASLDPDIVTINAHTNHYAMLSAVGDDTGAAGEVITTDDVRSAGTPLGRVAFSIGCHLGTSVSDTYASSGADVIDVAGQTDDWAQLTGQRSSVLVANTGFGYGTDEAVAYSERLMAGFAGQTARTATVGVAFATAKQHYLAGIATPGALDYKTLQQAVLYGLPMYRFHDAPPIDDDVATPQVDIDPVTGLQVVDIDTGSLHVGDADSCTDCLQQIDTPDGTYFDLVGPSLEGDPLAIQGRAIVPQLTQRYLLPGVEVGGFVPSAITSIDVAGSGSGTETFDPVVVRANLSDGEDERPAEMLDQAGPGTSARTTVFGDEVTMTVPLGAFRGATIRTDGEVIGQYRLDTRMAGSLYLRDTSDEVVDRTAPEVEDLRVGRRPVSGGDLVVVRVDAMDDSGIARGVAALRIGGTWRFVELVVPSGTPTTAALLGGVKVPSGASVDTVQYWVVDDNGNVGFGTNKSLRPDVSDLTDTETPWGTDPVITIDGPRRNGWYVGDVTVTVISGTSTTYHVFVDGELVSSLGVGEATTLSGTGSHTVLVVADDDPSKVTEARILIDATAPVGVFHTPNSAADDATRTFTSGAVVPIDLRCYDAVSDIASCTADDADGLLNTDTVGTFTLTGTVIDNAGNVSHAAVEYHVVSRYRFDGFFTPVVDDRIDVEAGSTVPFKFRVYDGATEITTTKIVASATWQQVTCDGQPLGSAFAAESQPRLRYTTDHFTFNAVSGASWQTGDCYRFTITLKDGASLSAIATVT